MTKEELRDKKGISIEAYGGGFILADYSGNRGEASYRGVLPNWMSQPLVQDPFFTESQAIDAAQGEPDMESN